MEFFETNYSKLCANLAEVMREMCFSSTHHTNQI